MGGEVIRQHAIVICLALQRPVQRPPRHVERLGYGVVIFALLDELAGMGDLLWGELGFAAHLHPTSDRRRAARLGAFLNQRAFQFRQYPDHLPHGAARGCGGINGFRQRPEGHAPHLQIIQKADQVAQRAAQPVEFPDRERVAISERLEALGQFGPPDMRPGSLISKDKIAPHLLQGGKLQVGVLVIGRDPRVADFHGSVLSLISGTTKPLI